MSCNKRSFLLNSLFSACFWLFLLVVFTLLGHFCSYAGYAMVLLCTLFTLGIRMWGEMGTLVALALHGGGFLGIVVLVGYQGHPDAAILAGVIAATTAVVTMVLVRYFW